MLIYAHFLPLVLNLNASNSLCRKAHTVYLNRGNYCMSCVRFTSRGQCDNKSGHSIRTSPRWEECVTMIRARCVQGTRSIYRNAERGHRFAK